MTQQSGEMQPNKGMFTSIMRLTRWKEFVPFVIPLTLFGALVSGQRIDWRIAMVAIANILVVAYAFMINDIEDAPDDAIEPERAARNPIAMGELPVRIAWLVSGAVAVASLVFYAFGGWWVLSIGTITLLLSHLYSWKPIRLKAWPVADVTSHSLMLSSLLFLAGFFAYSTNLGWVWLLVLATTLASVYGQLYNQIRDYEMDKAAGLHNTAIMVGERITRVLMYFCLLLAIVFGVAAFVLRVLPLWLPVVGGVIFAGVMLVYRPGTDMRGGEAADVSAYIQVQFLITANAVLGVWLVMVLFF